MTKGIHFTHKDLKDLCEYIDIDKEFHANAIWINRPNIEAILSRMKAAEKSAQLANEIRTGHVSWKYFKLAYDEWRRICGESL